jgi:helix-hairpin-helix protein
MREAVKKKEIKKDEIKMSSSSRKVELVNNNQFAPHRTPKSESPRDKGLFIGNIHILETPSARNQTIVRKPSSHISLKEMQKPLQQQKNHIAAPIKVSLQGKEQYQEKKQIQPTFQSEPSVKEAPKQQTDKEPKEFPSKEISGAKDPETDLGMPRETETPGKEPPKEEPVLKASEPGEVINRIIKTPASKIIGLYNQGIIVSEKVLTLQTEKARGNLPEIATPTGLPGKDIKKKKRYRAKVGKAPDTFKGIEEDKGKQINADIFKETEFNVIQDHKKQNFKASEISPEQSIDSIVLDSNKLPSSIGPRPEVGLVGKSNPDQMHAFETDASTRVKEARQDALKEAMQDFGEDRIYPKKATGVIKTSKSLKNPENKTGSVLQTPSIPKEAAKGIDQDMGAVLKVGFEKEQVRYEAAKENYHKESQKGHENTHSTINSLNEETKKVQQKERTKVNSTISGYRREWQDKINHVDKEYDNKAGNATLTQQGKIRTEKEKGEKEADKHFSKAEKDAAAARQKAEHDVEKEKKNKKKEAGGVIDWVVSKLSSFIDALKQAVSSIFNWLKEKVKQIFNAAKKLAMQAIESARKMIVGLIRGLGHVLKKLVSVAFAAFPEIAKAINAKIDKVCNDAIQKVNEAAEILKKGVAKTLDVLANVLDTILGVIQSVYMFAFNAIGMLVRGEFGNLAKYIFKSIVKLVGSSIKFLMTAMGIDSEAMDKVIDDPILFFRNLGSAIKSGIGNFLSNIWKHLKNGMFSWMFDAFEGIDIQFPKKFDLKGIFYLVAQILGLTWTSIRTQIVKRLGPMGESIMSKAETAVGIVKDLITKGPVVLWEKVKALVGNLKSMFFDAVIGWLKKTIVFKAFEMILSYINPVGAIFQAIKALYNIVMFFHENWQRIKDFVKTVYGSLAAIVQGKVSAAAKFITSSLAKAVPIVIGFLARLLSLHKIVEPIRKVIKKVTEPVKKVRNKVIGFVVTRVKKLLSKVGKAFEKVGKKAKKVAKKAVEKVIGWWKQRKRFKAKDGKTHDLFFKGSRKSAKLMVASKATLYIDFIKELKIAPQDKEKKQARDDALIIAKTIDTARAKKVAGNTENAKKRAQNEKAKAIDALLIRLRGKTIKLFGVIPQSDNPIYNSGTPFALKSIIKKLTRVPPKDGKGTEPTKEKYEVYDNLDLRRRGDKSASYYIRGHLLNHNLHGKGKWFNMTPLSREGNSKHEKEVESKVKTAVDSGAVVFYSVQPKYGKLPGKNNLIKEFEEKDGYPDKELKKKIVNAEDHVPLSLDCEAMSVKESIVKWTLGKVSVKNPVERNYESYLLHGDRPPPIVVKMNSSDEKHFATLPGIGDALAKEICRTREKLLKAHLEKKAFNNYEDLKQVKGIGDAKIANMKKYEKRIKDDFGINCIDFKN